MFRKIIRFFKRLKTNFYFKSRGISLKDFQNYDSASLTLEDLKRRDFDFNTEIRSRFKEF